MATVTVPTTKLKPCDIVEPVTDDLHTDFESVGAILRRVVPHLFKQSPNAN